VINKDNKTKQIRDQHEYSKLHQYNQSRSLSCDHKLTNLSNQKYDGDNPLFCVYHEIVEHIVATSTDL
jgi:hypothetical protein